MSAEKLTYIVEKLVRDAERTTEPARLRVIVEKLEQQGAWTEARHVETRLREIRRQYEDVNR